jgi:hypothetical protein
VLKRLEGWLPVCAQGDDLTIDYNRFGFQLLRCGRNSRIHARQVFVIPGPDLHTRSIFQQ